MTFSQLTREYMRVYKEMAIQKVLRLAMTEEEALEEAYKNESNPTTCKDTVDNQLKIKYYFDYFKKYL